MSDNEKGFMLINYMWQDRDIEEIRKLLDSGGTNTNCRDKFGNNALHNATVYSAIPRQGSYIVKLLLEHGANVNAVNNFLQTPLILFIQYKCALDAIDTLIEGGADVNHRDDENNTALHYCIQKINNKAEDVAKLLVSKNADVNIQNDFRETPLMNFIQSRASFSVIEMFLKAGAEVNCTDVCENTPLHYCSVYDEDGVDIIKMLLKMNANVNALNDDMETVLMKFIKSRRSVQLIQILLQAGANVNFSNIYGDTALHFSSRYEDIEGVSIIKCLLEHGASVNVTNQNLETPLINFIQHCRGIDTIRLLLNSGADVNHTDMHGKTALHYCIEYDESDCLSVVSLLLESNAEINLADEYHRTPLMELINRKCGFDTIKLLIDSGADIHCQDDDGNTALHLCSKCNSEYKLFKLLIDNNADVKKENNVHCTPLMACLYKRSISLDIIKLLLNASLPCTDLINNFDPSIFIIRGDSFVPIVFRYLLLENNNHWSENRMILEPHFRNFKKIETEISTLITELHKLKKFYIKDGVSLYDFCVESNTRRLGLFFKNSNLDIIDLKSSFSEYMELIEFKINIGKEWYNILNELERISLTTESQPNVTNVTLNFHCFSYLTNFLNKHDLLCLIAAAKIK